MRLPSFMPREDRFFGLMRSGAENVKKATRLLVVMMTDYKDPHARWADIKRVEELGDHIIHETMRNLHRTFVTPLDREDIAALGERIDDIVDAIEEAARYMVEYKIEAPTPQAIELAKILDRGAAVLYEAVDKLRFRGGKLKDILPHAVELNQLENEADQVTSKATAELFAHDTPVIMVIKWRDIYAQLELAADKMEDAANVLEGIVLKNG